MVLHRPLLLVVLWLLILRSVRRSCSLSQERISGLVPISFTHFDSSTLNYVRVTGRRAQQRLPQHVNLLGTRLSERYKGKASAASSFLIAHNSDVNDLTKLLEIFLNVELYTSVKKIYVLLTFG